MTIYIRDDDVLVHSSKFDNPFKKFQQVHRWICESDKMLHVPTILVTEIQDFPDCIEYVKNETKAGRMAPEIHGYEHVDYSNYSVQKTIDHLKLCQDFLWEKFDTKATKWYTPWGANSPELKLAADMVGLKLVDCDNIIQLPGIDGVIQRIKRGQDPNVFLDDKEIFYHWWLEGMRLKRLVEVLKWGSWELAEQNNGKWF